MQSLCHRGAAAAAAKLLQSCLTLCDPRDSSPPGSPVPGILQARTLEWVAISFSNSFLLIALNMEVSRKLQIEIIELSNNSAILFLGTHLEKTLI